jgi:hypothetical protein
MRNRVVVFGRVPEPGRVKTRLAAGIGAEVAAKVYRVLLEHTLGEAVATGWPVTLALAEPSPPGLDGWVPAGVDVELQVGGDLGTRMANAFAAHFRGGNDVVVLVGSDLPLLDQTLLREAVMSCERVPVVLGPAADGGYYLVGQRAPGLEIFTGIPWSVSETLATTRARLRALGSPHDELRMLRDLDTPEDLEAFLAEPALEHALRRGIEAALAAG